MVIISAHTSTKLLLTQWSLSPKTKILKVTMLIMIQTLKQSACVVILGFYLSVLAELERGLVDNTVEQTKMTCERLCVLFCLFQCQSLW